MNTNIDYFKLFVSINSISSIFLKFRKFLRFVFTHPIYFGRLCYFILTTEYLRINFLKHINNLIFNNAYSLNFSAKKRIDAFIFHHRYIQFILNPKLFQDKTLCWQFGEQDKTICTRFEFSPIDHTIEGECSVVLYLIDEPIAYMSFIFVDNNFIMDGDSNVLLVCRHQGVKGKFDKIREANKLMMNLRMGNALLSTLEGFCKSLEITKIYGVTKKIQPTGGMRKQIDNCNDMYDEFWSSLSSDLSLDGYYSLTIPLDRSRLSPTSRSHLSRHKRHLKRKAYFSESSFQLGFMSKTRIEEQTKVNMCHPMKRQH